MTTLSRLLAIPVQLLAQHGVVAVPRGMQQADGVRIAPHRHAVAFAQVEMGVAVEVNTGIGGAADERRERG